MANRKDADIELTACALMSAQADGDEHGMRQIMSHIGDDDREAMLTMLLGEIAKRDADGER